MLFISLCGRTIGGLCSAFFDYLGNNWWVYEELSQIIILELFSKKSETIFSQLII
tara:strand:+ start:2380 stop:2544 length:165 start_codon:yes stop_codon:yes gene_type:complete